MGCRGWTSSGSTPSVPLLSSAQTTTRQSLVCGAGGVRTWHSRKAKTYRLTTRHTNGRNSTQSQRIARRRSRITSGSRARTAKAEISATERSSKSEDCKKKVEDYFRQQGQDSKGRDFCDGKIF